MHTVGRQRGPESDPLGRFVGLLTDTLDHPARVDELAARLYWSRSHVDRMISAAAGETPARFRRRILLERAAFRLLTTDHTVLDIAVSAGFSSHESFLRAFRRAYGCTPSSWRQTPTPIGLPTPNEVHFHPPAGIRLPSPTKVTSMDLVHRMIDHHLWLLDRLVERAGTLTDDQLDRPIDISVPLVDDHPTVRRLLSRLVGQMHMWNEVIAVRSYDFGIERHESIEAIGRRLSEQGPVFAGHVATVIDQGRLEETFVFADADPPKMFTYGGLIAHVLTFAAHRRTLVVGALTAYGIEDLDDGDLREWVPEPTGPVSSS